MAPTKLKEVHAVKDKLKAGLPVARPDLAKAFKEIAVEIQTARSSDNKTALDEAVKHLMDAAKELES